jgi:peptidoglycan/xylan/chitin deacetylase (PgdA/CDA1 family)
MSLKSLVYKTALNSLYFSGLHTLMAPWTRGLGIVLTLHHVRPLNEKPFRPNEMLEITPAFLDELLTWLREDGYEFVSLETACQRIRQPARNNRKFVAITFDDGYRDNLEFAYPILQHHGAPFTIFLTTGFLDRSSELWWIAAERLVEKQNVIAVERPDGVEYLNCRTATEKMAAFTALRSHLLLSNEQEIARKSFRELCWRYDLDLAALCDELIMDWEDVRKLASDPLMTVGAHTIDHYNLARVSPERLEMEVRSGTKLLEAALSVRPKHFAYPYGFADAMSARAVNAVIEAGFEAGFTTMPDTLTDKYGGQMGALPRVSVNGLYQRLKYIDVLASGAGFKLKNRGRRIKVPA